MCCISKCNQKLVSLTWHKVQCFNEQLEPSCVLGILCDGTISWSTVAWQPRSNNEKEIRDWHCFILLSARKGTSVFPKMSHTSSELLLWNLSFKFSTMPLVEAQKVRCFQKWWIVLNSQCWTYSGFYFFNLFFSIQTPALSVMGFLVYLK